MKIFSLIVFAFSLLIVPLVEGKESYFDRRIKIEIVSSSEKIAKGDTNLFAIKITLSPGWHIYWLNPGDAGEAPVFEITTNVSEGTIIPVAHPIPSYRNTKGIVTLEHRGIVYFPFRIYLPKDFPNNSLEINLYAKWLVCKEKCIPGEVKLKKYFPLSKNISKRNFEPKIKQIFQSLSMDTIEAKFEFFESYAIMQINLDSVDKITKVFFYPLTEGLFDLESNPNFSVEDSWISVEIPLLQYIWGERDKIEGILELVQTNKTKKYFWVKFVNKE